MLWSELHDMLFRDHPLLRATFTESMLCKCIHSKLVCIDYSRDVRVVISSQSGKLLVLHYGYRMSPHGDSQRNAYPWYNRI